MSEIDYLKLKLKDMEKAFDKLHQRHMVLLKEQGELERKNEQLMIENNALRYALKYVKHIEVDIDVDGVVDDG